MVKVTRRNFALGVTSAFALPSVFAEAGTESPALAAAKKWFREAQYGMMVHCGHYALLGAEW